jgi:16S rRNA processing protein RimM
VFKNSDISTEKTKEKKTEGDQREYDNNFKIKKVRVKSNGSFVVRIKNCNTRNDAEAIIGTRLYTLKSELPKPKDGEFYIHNLVGKKLIDSNEKNIGTIKNILNYGAGDIIEIKLHDQKETILLPFDNEHFSDIEEGHIKIILY